MHAVKLRVHKGGTLVRALVPYMSSAPRTWALTPLKSCSSACRKIRRILPTQKTSERRRREEDRRRQTHRLMMLSAVRRALSTARGPASGQTAVALKPSR